MNSRIAQVMKLKLSPFFIGLFSICLAYAIFEYFYIPRGVLAVDEFVFARHLYEYTFNLPYANFPPYKGVLGHYLLSIPLIFSNTLLTPLFYVKGEVALINLVCFFLAGYWATRFFNKTAVLLTMLAILSNQLLLIYSADLRVDMLTNWLCLFSALSALDNRFRLGGFLLGTAFLVSQKALWYVIAMNGAIGLCWILFPLSHYSGRSLLSLNLFTLLPIILYVIGWSWVSSPAIVLHSLFYEAYLQATIEWYTKIYLICWKVAFTHGALLFFLWPLTFISLKEKNTPPNIIQQRLFVITFASTALLLFTQYKQPFPYNFVFTMPAFFLLYSSFITWLMDAKKTHSSIHLPTLSAIFIIAFYTLGILMMIHLFSLSALYYLTVLFLIAAHGLLSPWLSQPSFKSINFTTALTIFIALGILYPLQISLMIAHRLDGHYQQTMVRLTAALLKNDGDYVSGIPLIYQKDQPIDGLKNIIGPALGYLYTQNDNLKPLLLPSLLLSPTTPEKILEDFERFPVKLIVSNYRILALPTKILRYIGDHYQHFYGSIYLYAPKIFPNQLSFDLTFSGRYRLESHAVVKIDGKKRHPHQLFYLKKGSHLTDSRQAYRLALVPTIYPGSLNPAYQLDQYDKMINPIIP